MISFKNEKEMYNFFIDKDILTTKELLSIGFTNKDLTRLIEDGKIKRVKRGYYELGSINGLLNYCKILLRKRYKNIERARQGFKRCLEIDPENGSVNIRLFLDAIISGEYEKAFTYFDVLDKTDNEFYKKDQNMWLFLLSFLVDVPDKYKDRVKNMQLVDLLSKEGDFRYKDRLLQNKIRNAIFKQNFKEAKDLITNGIKGSDKKINVVITEFLLNAVIRQNIIEHENIYDLIVKGDYEEVERLLSGALDLHGLNLADEQFLIVIRDLISIIDMGVVPEIDDASVVNSFSDAIRAHNYSKVFEFYRNSASKKNSKSSKFMGILLERIDSEIKKLGLVIDVSKDNNSLESFPSINSSNELFTNITVCLMNQDVDSAFGLLDTYLNSIDKVNFRGYIGDLIKLGALKKDASFSDAMLVLSELSRDEYDFDVANYIQDFYFNLARKNFKEAAIYLDILEMSEMLGSVYINTYDMKDRLIEDAKMYGLSEEELGIKKKEESVSLVDVSSDAQLKIEDVMPPIVEETTVVNEDVPYTIVSAVDDLLNDTNMIMLEAMDSKAIEETLAITSCFPKILSTVIEESDGRRRIVLRYYDKNGPYVDISRTLKEADLKYKNWEYDDAISLYQSVLPKMENPRSFIYARLGFCYQKTTYDGDYSKAIDYLTMAMAQSVNEDEPRNYSKVIADMKSKSNYDGKEVSLDVSSQSGKKYEKLMNNDKNITG